MFVPIASAPTPGMTPIFAQPSTSGAPQANFVPPPVNALHAGIGKRLAQGIGRIVYFIGLGLTLGGRAAYADLFDPKEYTRGQVLTLERKPVSARVEPGFIVWCAAWIVFGLLMLLGLVWGLASFLILFLILIALSLPGWRFLGFSHSSAETLFQLVRHFKRGTQLQTRFVLQTTQGHQTVVMRGALEGTMQQLVNGKTKTLPFNDTDKTLAVNHLVRVWGMSEGNILRVWKLEFLEINATPAQIWLRGPRVLPLTAALFIPLGFWFTVRIITLFFA